LLDSIIQGDCIDIMRGMASASIDLVVTDPPYLTNYRPRDGRKVASDRNGNWLLPSFSEIHRLLKPNTLCVSFYGWPHAELFMGAWKEIGFAPVSHLVCIKEYASRTGYTCSHHETMYLLAKGRPPRPVNPPKDVLEWRYTGNVLHTTQKPVEVMQTLIESFSKPGDIVLDPFAGSGSTGVAARNCGRHFILIEKAVRCFKVAADRLAIKA
jgi:site-specific DNA-methyltransferase (adenine-specific)